MPAGTPVIAAEEPGEDLYVVLSGSVKVHAPASDGSEVILAVLGPGEVVGEMSLADSLGRSADVTSLEETTLLRMERGAFVECLESSPVLARNLANLLSRRLRLANTHARALSTLDVPGRVAAQLLAFAREHGTPAEGGVTLIPMPLTQTDLAALVGASRVRVNQALSYFRRSGAISATADHRFVVRDPEALARRAR